MPARTIKSEARNLLVISFKRLQCVAKPVILCPRCSKPSIEPNEVLTISYARMKPRLMRCSDSCKTADSVSSSTSSAASDWSAARAIEEVAV